MCACVYMCVCVCACMRACVCLAEMYRFYACNCWGLNACMCTSNSICVDSEAGAEVCNVSSVKNQSDKIALFFVYFSGFTSCCKGAGMQTHLKSRFWRHFEKGEGCQGMEPANTLLSVLLPLSSNMAMTSYKHLLSVSWLNFSVVSTGYVAITLATLGRSFSTSSAMPDRPHASRLRSTHATRRGRAGDAVVLSLCQQYQCIKQHLGYTCMHGGSVGSAATIGDCVRVRACVGGGVRVRVCVCVCVCVCTRACVCVCVCVGGGGGESTAQGVGCIGCIGRIGHTVPCVFRIFAWSRYSWPVGESFVSGFPSTPESRA